jgi:predicted Zn-dependent protease
MNMRSFQAVFFLLSVSFFLSACGTLGTYNPATGRKEFIAISTSEEVAMGQKIHQDIIQQFALSKDQSQIDRIRRIGEKLSLVSDRQDYAYRFYVVEKDDINAFTTPGGNIYFFTGLLKKLKTDDQIAAVLAHEIGHCAARHTIKKFQAAMSANLLGSILLRSIDAGAAQQITQLSTSAVLNLVFSAYGRKDEYEADRLGIKYMYLAGYNLQGVIETLDVLEKESEDKKGPPLILRTHPFVSDRIQQAQQEIEAVKKQFEDI